MSFVYCLATRPLLPYLPNEVPLDGDINKIRTIDQTPDGGGRTHKGVAAGRKCETEHFPTKVEWRGRSTDPVNIGDFDSLNSWHVSEPARDFIESFEPAVHQFVPFEMLKVNKPFQPRYWWVIGNRLDSVDREHTNHVLLGGRMWRTAKNVAESFPEYLPVGTDIELPPRMVFNRAQIGRAQVWRDKFIDTGGPLVSQEFADALRRSELTGYEIGEMGEVF